MQTSGMLQAISKLQENVLKSTYHESYRAMYSSILGGIITDSALMLIPLDDHMVHRGHGVFDTALIFKGYVLGLASCNPLLTFFYLFMKINFYMHIQIMALEIVSCRLSRKSYTIHLMMSQLCFLLYEGGKLFIVKSDFLLRK